MTQLTRKAYVDPPSRASDEELAKTMWQKLYDNPDTIPYYEYPDTDIYRSWRDIKDDLEDDDDEDREIQLAIQVAQYEEMIHEGQGTHQHFHLQFKTLIEKLKSLCEKHNVKDIQNPDRPENIIGEAEHILTDYEHEVCFFFEAAGEVGSEIKGKLSSQPAISFKNIKINFEKLLFSLMTRSENGEDLKKTLNDLVANLKLCPTGSIANIVHAGMSTDGVISLDEELSELREQAIEQIAAIHVAQKEVALMYEIHVKRCYSQIAKSHDIAHKGQAALLALNDTNIPDDLIDDLREENELDEDDQEINDEGVQFDKSDIDSFYDKFTSLYNEGTVITAIGLSIAFIIRSAAVTDSRALIENASKVLRDRYNLIHGVDFDLTHAMTIDEDAPNGYRLIDDLDIFTRGLAAHTLLHQEFITNPRYTEIPSTDFCVGGVSTETASFQWLCDDAFKPVSLENFFNDCEDVSLDAVLKQIIDIRLHEAILSREKENVAGKETEYRKDFNFRALKAGIHPEFLYLSTLDEIQDATSHCGDSKTYRERFARYLIENQATSSLISLINPDKDREKTRKAIVSWLVTTLHQKNPVWDTEDGSLTVNAEALESLCEKLVTANFEKSDSITPDELENLIPHPIRYLLPLNTINLLSTDTKLYAALSTNKPSKQREAIGHFIDYHFEKDISNDQFIFILITEFNLIANTADYDLCVEPSTRRLTEPQISFYLNAIDAFIEAANNSDTYTPSDFMNKLLTALYLKLVTISTFTSNIRKIVVQSTFCDHLTDKQKVALFNLADSLDEMVPYVSHYSSSSSFFDMEVVGKKINALCKRIPTAEFRQAFLSFMKTLILEEQADHVTVFDMLDEIDKSFLRSILKIPRGFYPDDYVLFVMLLHSIDIEDIDIDDLSLFITNPFTLSADQAKQITVIYNNHIYSWPRHTETLLPVMTVSGTSIQPTSLYAAQCTRPFTTEAETVLKCLLVNLPFAEWNKALEAVGFTNCSFDFKQLTERSITDARMASTFTASFGVHPFEILQGNFDSVKYQMASNTARTVYERLKEQVDEVVRSPLQKRIKLSQS